MFLPVASGLLRLKLSEARSLFRARRGSLFPRHLSDGCGLVSARDFFDCGTKRTGFKTGQGAALACRLVAGGRFERPGALASRS